MSQLTKFISSGTWLRWMLSVFFLVFSLSAFSASTLSYTFQRLSDHQLQIQLSFLGSSSGETILFLPDVWGEKKELYACVKDLTVITKSVVLKQTLDPAQRKMIHPPSERITIQYTLTQRFTGQPKKMDEVFEPVIQRDAFYFIGSTSLILPQLENNTLIDVKFKWVMPSDWSIANSFGMNQANQIVHSTAQQLKDALFMAGHIQLKEITYEHTSVWVATIGQFTQLNLDHYFKICAKLVNFQQNFWKDPGHYRLLALVSFDSKKDSFRGTGLYRSFLIALPQNASMNTGFGLPWLTAHELFHAWNRPEHYAIPSGHQEESIYWLSEGFTDYYALESLLRTKIYSFSEYLDAYNWVLREYYTSPVRTYTNQEVEQYFWVSRDVDKLPYQRGHILAHHWNTEIIHQSHGRYSLDDFFRAIQPQSRATVKPRSLDEMEVISKKYLTHGIKKDIQQYIDEGKPLPLDPKAFSDCARLMFKKEKVRLEAFPVTFDPETHIVTFVLKDSQAEKAGLKVGDKIIHIDYKKDDPNALVRVVIKRKNKLKNIQFYSDRFRWVQVPQFELVGRAVNSQ